MTTENNTQFKHAVEFASFNAEQILKLIENENLTSEYKGTLAKVLDTLVSLAQCHESQIDDVRKGREFNTNTSSVRRINQLEIIKLVTEL